MKLLLVLSIALALTACVSTTAPNGTKTTSFDANAAQEGLQIANSATQLGLSDAKAIKGLR